MQSVSLTEYQYHLIISFMDHICLVSALRLCIIVPGTKNELSKYFLNKWMNEWSFQQDPSSLKSGRMLQIFSHELSTMSGTDWYSLVFAGWFMMHYICRREIFFFKLGDNHAHLVESTSWLIFNMFPSSVEVNHAKGRTIHCYQQDSTLQTNLSLHQPCHSLTR